MKIIQHHESQTIAKHGLSVFKFTKDIISGSWGNLKLPDWFKEYHVQIVSNIHDIKTIEKYNCLHDCGKPFCLEYDSEGKKHFPNHSQISKEIFTKFFPDNLIVQNLIGYDMCLHTETAEEILKYQWDIKTAMTLLITSFAEIHANAELFGGCDSVSFKMKYKKLDKRGKMLMNHYFPKIKAEHPYVYILVRNDLTNAQKAVQGTHAAIELAKNSLDTLTEHPSVIYLIVKNENKLKEIAKELLDVNINIRVFREPDVDYQMTSIITEPIFGDRRRFLKRFQLMK